MMDEIPPLPVAVKIRWKFSEGRVLRIAKNAQRGRRLSLRPRRVPKNTGESKLYRRRVEVADGLRRQRQQHLATRLQLLLRLFIKARSDEHSLRWFNGHLRRINPNIPIIFR